MHRRIRKLFSVSIESDEQTELMNLNKKDLIGKLAKSESVVITIE